jgi:dihydrodipicolinate synthase/N-acetylneuraminate lyase
MRQFITMCMGHSGSYATGEFIRLVKYASNHGVNNLMRRTSVICPYKRAQNFLNFFEFFTDTQLYITINIKSREGYIVIVQRVEQLAQNSKEFVHMGSSSISGNG